VEYSFDDHAMLRGVRVNLEIRDGRLAFDVDGPASFAVRRALAFYCNWHSKLTPLASLDGANIYSIYLPPIPSRAHNRMLGTFLRRWAGRERTPMAVSIAVTTACQLACRHCSASLVRDDRPPMGAEEIERIVDESLDIGVTNVTFTGGEPLLRDDLERLVRHVPPEKAVALAFTNGLALDRQRARSLKSAGAYGVHVSLDAPDPEAHDGLRRKKGCFEAVEAAIRNARAEGLLAGLSTYATNDSVEKGHLSRIAELACDWGAHEITVFDVLPAGEYHRCNDVLLTRRNRWRLMASAKALNKLYRGRLRTVTQSWTNCGWGFAWFIGCLAANYQFHINAHGHMTPCDFTPLSFGDAHTEPVSTLWRRMIEHPEYRKHRKGCRLQSRPFQRRYTDRIPEGAAVPYPIAGLPADPS
jgi:MoaA/NifB/PqqE/SkfB family radical SAM enzyme